MANGVELWLAYPYTQWAGFAPKEAPRLPDPLPEPGDSYEPDSPYAQWYERFREWAVPLGPALRKAWLEALKGAGLTWGDPKAKGKRTRGREGGGRFERVEGVECLPFGMEVADLENEAGFEPDSRPVGVPLSGRYYPVFLDIDPDGDASGGLPNPIDLDDPRLTSLVKLAGYAIRRRLPWMEHATLHVVHLHY